MTDNTELEVELFTCLGCARTFIADDAHGAVTIGEFVFHTLECRDRWMDGGDTQRRLEHP